MRAILGFLRRRARDAGVTDGRGGAVAILQRFGGALNLNVHIHALVVDGVFAKDGESVRFHPCPSLHAADVDEVLATVEAYVQRRAGGGADAGNDGDDTLDGVAGRPVHEGPRTPGRNRGLVRILLELTLHLGLQDPIGHGLGVEGASQYSGDHALGVDELD